MQIGTSYPKIATNFQSLYLAEIFALLLWNFSWWLLLTSFRFSQIFIIFRWVVLEICDSSFLEFSKIRGPYSDKFWQVFVKFQTIKNLSIIEKKIKFTLPIIHTNITKLNFFSKIRCKNDSKPQYFLQSSNLNNSSCHTYCHFYATRGCNEPSQLLILVIFSARCRENDILFSWQDWPRHVLRLTDSMLLLIFSVTQSSKSVLECRVTYENFRRKASKLWQIIG